MSIVQGIYEVWQYLRQQISTGRLSNEKQIRAKGCGQPGERFPAGTQFTEHEMASYVQSAEQGSRAPDIAHPSGSVKMC